MQIVGGFYREMCQTPPWDAKLGSGGRAAVALSKLSPTTTLHTYVADSERFSLSSLLPLPEQTHATWRPHPIIFSYFHPLSRPHVQPRPIEPQQVIRVSGEAILRFGFLEGDAVVSGNRVVYDPQTWRNPSPFGANGSKAEELAIVLNELELRSATGLHDLSSAASSLMHQNNASAVVAKGGAKGASVFVRSRKSY